MRVMLDGKALTTGELTMVLIAAVWADMPRLRHPTKVKDTSDQSVVVESGQVSIPSPAEFESPRAETP